LDIKSKSIGESKTLFLFSNSSFIFLFFINICKKNELIFDFVLWSFERWSHYLRSFVVLIFLHFQFQMGIVHDWRYLDPSYNEHEAIIDSVSGLHFD
jgi:hypothetical protein